MMLAPLAMDELSAQFTQSPAQPKLSEARARASGLAYGCTFKDAEAVHEYVNCISSNPKSFPAKAVLTLSMTTAAFPEVGTTKGKV
ncbi:MAG: hypothetical protein EBZ31_06505 [Flavobacteriia bacterium]|nr:hypothetical protein [Flavobacteriia bacterium]